MKIKRIEIRRFKRFTSLEIKNIPGSAKLIILAGPNGSGKSSFFDALNVWYRNNWKPQFSIWDESYHLKKNAEGQGEPAHQQKVEFHEEVPHQDTETAFYFRSAYRNEPEFILNQLQQVGSIKDENRFNRMIDNDAAVRLNYTRLVSTVLVDALETAPGGKRLDEFREEAIGDIRDSFKRLFKDMMLNSLGSPLSDGTFRFTKGVSQGFAYKNLSGGEKAAFDLILDMHIKKKEYRNTIFCIDEPEAHMNTRLQAQLLSVLYDIVPDNCQLILATHSIGMMRRAQDIEDECPGSVVFLDFDKDFDQHQVIEPTKPTRAFWRGVYAVALDDLADLVVPKQIIICEGAPKTSRGSPNQEYDAKCYDKIFEEEFPNTLFVSGGSASAVQSDSFTLMATIEKIATGTNVIRLIDRDDLSDREIAESKAEGVHVLSRRNIESYLLDNEVLTALAQNVSEENKIDEIIDAKNKLIQSKSGSVDDLKPIAGELYNECKRILGLAQCGSNAKSFMLDKLSPLIRPSMQVYQELKRDIFDTDTKSVSRS